jgi:PAS domain S-box-containing protein
MAVFSEKMIGKAIEICKEPYTTSELIENFEDASKECTGAVKTIIKEVGDSSEKIGRSEETVLNSKKPYVDNRLNSYSGFVELIEYFRKGFRSCLIVPISTEKNNFGVLTVLSDKEEFFSKDHIQGISTAARIVGREIEFRKEKEKAESFERYFNTVFDSDFAQVIVDNKGEVLKANRKAINGLSFVSENLEKMEIGNFFRKVVDIEKIVASEKPLEVEEPESKKVYRILAKRIDENLSCISLYDITELRNLEDKSELPDKSNDEAFMLLDNNMKIRWVGGNSEVLRTDPINLIGRGINSIIFEKDLEAFGNSFGTGGSGRYNGYVKFLLGGGMESRMNLEIGRAKHGLYAVISRSPSRYIENLERDIEQIIELSPELVMVVDDEGFVRKANKNAQKLLKYGNDELLGIPLTKLFPDSDNVDRMSAALGLVKERGVLTDVYATMIAKDGSFIKFTQSIKTLVDMEGRLEGYLIIGRELNTKMMMEEMRSKLEEITRHAEKMKQESDLKTQFIFNVSHELKTPITNINGYARLLIEGVQGELTPEQKEGVNTIITENDRLMQLIQQILDVAKLEAGKIKLDWQEVDLNAIKENASIKSLEEMVKAKGLDYNFIIDYSVPKIEADPNRLIQVFVNLIVNAYKFTEKGGITIKAFRKGKNIKVEVRDTGIGISPDDRNKLFRRFYQLQKRGLTKQEGSGTGLGLSIVKEIVTLHGGRVGVDKETAVGKGSIFFFTLPINRKSKKDKK